MKVIGPLFILLIFLSFSEKSFGQKDSLSNENKVEVFSTEVIPQFPGGKDVMNSFINRNIEYPELAKKKKIKGRVVVGFYVTEEGVLDSIHIVKDIGFGCGEELMRVIKMMPPWKPGRQNGKAIRTFYSIPLNYELN